MTAHTSSVFRFTRYTLPVAVAAMAVAGSVWINGSGAEARITPATPHIDVTALLATIDVANLPVITVDQPF